MVYNPYLLFSECTAGFHSLRMLNGGVECTQCGQYTLIYQTSTVYTDGTLSLTIRQDACVSTGTRDD